VRRINLTSITIPESVEIIDAFAFRRCAGLTSLIFEADSKLNNINEKAFSVCFNINSLTSVLQFYGNKLKVSPDAFEQGTNHRRRFVCLILNLHRLKSFKFSHPFASQDSALKSFFIKVINIISNVLMIFML
jgi:BspA type Leucine rich repeat region (6 copies)